MARRGRKGHGDLAAGVARAAAVIEVYDNAPSVGPRRAQGEANV